MPLDGSYVSQQAACAVLPSVTIDHQDAVRRSLGV
jgi:hypothetical protein